MSDILSRLRERQKRCKGARQADAWRLMRDAIAEIERLQKIIDSRPAINAGLPETYIKWSQSIYTMEAVQALGINRN